jgi:hypothetical protein
MHAGHGVEDMRLVDAQAGLTLQFVGEDVQQDLRIGIRVDMAQILAEQILFELPGIGEVAVVRQTDAERRVDVKRLCLGAGLAAGGRIAHMADAHIAQQPQHVPGMEHVAHQTVVLAQIQALLVAGHDAGGILSAMLQDGQAVVQGLIDPFTRHDTDDSTHGSYLSLRSARYSPGDRIEHYPPCPWAGNRPATAPAVRNAAAARSPATRGPAAAPSVRRASPAPRR